MKKYLYIFFAGMMCTAFLFSCKQVEVFEQNRIIPSGKWMRNVPVQGTFEITDTLSAYNIYIVLRHTDAYEYNNIWLNIGLQSPGGEMNFQKVDLTLGNDIHGWEGTGMNDIREVRKLISGRPRQFIKPGVYHFQIGHIMRNDPLLNVLNAGLRVEKVYQP
ncbi:MAG TPA: gliding motility lipoprotein GldH [Ferruginibacter sp.]|mgnify:FL=1|nr:gliding motility lipoprotein GldH [Ferruginibacter sp.]HRN79047.1 gliding motility lipoprotein GldH [Ferruginibacter sp.]HRO18065.1 gliding motility lipoprotein GldH [Ferruginibacter sp.]HRQ19856.1 gliding motility lipoprotein GldH [Ferruginibacter sp.]